MLYKFLLYLTKRYFRKNKILSNYIDIRKYYIEHNKYLIKKLEVSLYTTNPIKHELICYLQLVIYRSKKLIEGLITLIIFKNLIPIALIVRAHFEVTSLLGFLIHKLHRYEKEEMGKDELLEILKKLLLGSRISELQNRIESINIITIIEYADKVLNKIQGNDKKHIKDNYDFLSDFCHPNITGLAFSAEIIENECTVFQKKSFIDDRDSIFFRLITLSLKIFFVFLEIIDEMRSRVNI